MVAVADEEALYLLKFADGQNWEQEMKRLQMRFQSVIISGRTKPIEMIESELNQYFAGRWIEFKTPLFLMGSSFQKQVSEELQKIPLGETRSYSEIAAAIGKPSAVRAVGLAIGANRLVIVIPCHRVINKNGQLGGYNGGLNRKQQLLDHEKKSIYTQTI